MKNMIIKKVGVLQKIVLVALFMVACVGFKVQAVELISLTTLISKPCTHDNIEVTTAGVLSLNEGALFSELFINTESKDNNITLNSVLLPSMVHERLLESLKFTLSDIKKLDGSYVHITGIFKCKVIRPYTHSGKFHVIRAVRKSRK